jgi:replicative DNA helicase
MAHRAGFDDEKTEVERFRTLWAQAARPGNPATAAEAAVSARVATSGPGAQEAPQRLSAPFLEVLTETLDEIEAVGSRGMLHLPYRIPTGLADLDALLGGWSPGCLIIIGGRPSSGKTTLLQNFCRAASIIGFWEVHCCSC